MLNLPRDQIRAIAGRHGAWNIRIFGSVARGEDGPDSDIDLLVDMENGRSLLDLINIQFDLEDLLGHKVDVCTEAELCQYFREDVLAEAAPL